MRSPRQFARESAPCASPLPSTLIGIAVATALVTAIVGCHSDAPNAGHQIVLVEKPILFGHVASIRNP